MKILVCVKQVPEKDSRYKLTADSLGIDDQDLTFETNESDLYALEEALRLKEKRGGEVVLLSVGPERVQKVLKSGLAMGADRAIHLCDPGLDKGDAHVTAKAIWKAIREEGFEVIFTGVESEDMAFAQTGTLLAALLGWDHATIVMEVSISDDGSSAVVKRELESNVFERVQIGLPAVLTIQSGINQPRYATLKGIMQAKKKELRSLNAEQLGMGASEVGTDGSRVEHQRLFFPEKKKQTVFIEGAPEEAAKALMEKLQKEARVL
ncbi:MAG: electron transfer flavoprotein subunit beta/FixA family protein [Acidobacteriota bacterium]